MRGQISLDLLFAVTLIALTVIGMVNLSQQEISGAATLNKQAQLKVFAISLRDTIVKAYAVGSDFAIRKEFPLSFGENDKVIVVLNSSTNELEIEAHLGGDVYTTVEKLPVPVGKTTLVELNSTNKNLWIVVKVENGERYVELSENP